MIIPNNDIRGNDITCIGIEVFCDCSNLTSVTIPDGVTSIEYRAFANCGLTSVTIPNNVTDIGRGAFALCTSLASVTIPDSVTRIRQEAFMDCSSINTVTITANGGDAETVKALLQAAGVTGGGINWIMP